MVIYLLESNVKVVGIYKKILPEFSNYSSFFFLLIWFVMYEMVGIMDIYKYLNISIGTVMKNQDMLKYVRDYLKAKRMCKHAVKKLPYRLRYVLDKYKTQ